MKKRYSITIRGSVQGVGYRYYAKQEADALGIRGFAGNENDGSVLIEAEGDEAALAQFLDWCYSGSPSAIIDSVEFSEDKPKGYASFSILTAS